MIIMQTYYPNGVGDGGLAAEFTQFAGGNGYVIVDLLGESNVCAHREIPYYVMLHH
jgi:hypothetical protein